VASIETVETVVTSIVGIAGLIPTMEAIKHKKNLVTAGHIVMSEAARMGVFRWTVNILLFFRV